MIVNDTTIEKILVLMLFYHEQILQSVIRFKLFTMRFKL